MKSFMIFFFFTLLSVSLASEVVSITIVGYEENQETSWRTDDEVMALFEEWLVEHGKVYNALGEKEKRFEIFKDNLRYIDQHNSILNQTYKLGWNQFADLTDDEYRSIYLGTRIDANSRAYYSSSSEGYLPEAGVSVPASIDWRKKGTVLPIKNQGQCGSCWAFSAVAAVEAINKMVTGKLISLSEQELVDCDKSNHGCKGGIMNRAFQYIINNRGIDTGAHYPYKAKRETCRSDRKRVVTINGYQNVRSKDEKALQIAAAQQVVSAGLESANKDFRFYKSGIFTGKCGTKLDHAVNIVGYGSEKRRDFWIIRNSWGTTWGEKGYMRLERNVREAAGRCGIAMMPSYPTKKGRIDASVDCDSSYDCAPGEENSLGLETSSNEGKKSSI